MLGCLRSRGDRCEPFGLDGPVERWRELRAADPRGHLHAGFDRDKNSFVQYYGGKALDASLLLMPQVGFLPPEDPRVHGTIAAIERELMGDGSCCAIDRRERRRVRRPARERSSPAASGWPMPMCCAGGSTTPGHFSSVCWSAQRSRPARRGVRPRGGRLLGNFPQAFSHIGLINTAHNLCKAAGPAEQRAARAAPATADR